MATPYPTRGQLNWDIPLKSYIDTSIDDAETSVGEDVDQVASDLSDHEAATTGVHGIPDTALLETKTGAQGKANAAQANAEATAAADATAKANAAKSGAEATAATNLTAHVTKASGAHAASSISYAGGPLLPAGTVEGALDALDGRVFGVVTAPATDFNTLITPGTYRIGTNGATTENNAPMNNFQGLIRVERESTQTVQMAVSTVLVSGAQGTTWIRAKHSSTWGAWRELAFKGALAATDIPYAGGVLIPAGTVEEALDTLDEWRRAAPLAGDSIDADLLKTPGTYFVTSANATGSTGLPTPNSGMLRVTMRSGWGVQEFFNFRDDPRGRMWIRLLDGGTWRPWVEQMALGVAVAGNTIVGTGMPNGVVSAPVGTRYIDTAATNGAREWYKDAGTWNTGWIVTNGDTGWRDITDLIGANGWTATALRIKRNGSTVQLVVEGMNSKDATGLTVFLIPSGFRADVYTSGTLTVDALASTDGSRPWVTPGPTANVRSPIVAGDNKNLNGSLTYVTSQPWPTTLPGTPV